MPRLHLLMLIAVSLCATTQANAQLVLVSKTVAPCPIFTSAQPDPLEVRAAGALAKYLEEISGQEFKIAPLPAELPDRAILIGRAVAATPKDLGGDSFVIETKGSRLQIYGGEPVGTIYGVYAFLEEVLGCKWWSYDDEDVPHRAAIEVAELNIVRKPAFIGHYLASAEANNAKNDFVYKSRSTGLERFTGGHTIYALLGQYGKTHPEIYPADAQGDRKPNNIHLCYTAPGIAEALADTLGNEVEKRKGDVTHFT